MILRRFMIERVNNFQESSEDKLEEKDEGGLP